MKVIIIGCGRVGSGLAQVMGRRGHDVTVIDTDPAALNRLGPAFKGRKVVGVGFDREILLEAGIHQADALAAVTVSDEANVVSARLARQVFRVPRVVARVYDPGKAEIYRRFGLQTISPVSLGVDRLAEMLSFAHLDTVVSLGSSEVDIVNLDVPRLLVGRSVNEITVPGEIHVVALTRAGKTFLPTLGTVFQEADLLHVAVLVSSADRLGRLIGS
jgi:trk system potassium uptake protein TrkA